jgi:hypothetical protein
VRAAERGAIHRILESTPSSDGNKIYAGFLANSQNLGRRVSGLGCDRGPALLPNFSGARCPVGHTYGAVTGGVPMCQMGS